MRERLVIGIPTCNRPERLLRCLDSVRRTAGDRPSILVVDSGQVSLEPARLKSFQARVLKVDQPIGPAAARHLITVDSDEGLILFLDDDLIARAGAIEKLLAFLQVHPDVMIAAGHWVQDGRQTELGQYIEFGLTDQGGAAFKRFIHPSEALKANLQAVCCDIPLASMVMRREATQHVAFDGRYRFYYDMFDFGMQCKTKGIVPFVVLGALFDHVPGGYQAPSLKDAPQPGDIRTFVEKWGVTPVGPLTAGTEALPFGAQAE